MLFRALAVAGLFLAASNAPVMAQDLRGPRELPPPGFQGQQYVDSRGCVFLRGGIGGRVTWVPRVSSNRSQLCGMTPSFTPEPAAVAEAAPAPAPRPRAAGAPMDTVASTTTPPRIRQAPPRNPVPAASYAAPAPVASPAPAPAAAPVARQPAVAAAPAPRAAAPVAAPPVVQAASVTPGCPAHAPYGERLQTTDGRTALLCVRSPDQMPAFAQRMGVSQGRVAAPAPEVVARSAPTAAPKAPVSRTAVSTDPVTPASAVGPRYLADGRVQCPASAPVARAFPLRGGGSTLLCTTADGGLETAVAGRSAETGQTVAPIRVPKGYKPAWNDDRLNPRRGQGTAAGMAAQDQIWTRETPARLVAEVPPAQQRVVTQRRVTASASNAPKATLSTSSAPKAPAAAAKGRFYVQVGSFGVAANADGARARLSRLGLPAATGRATIKGKPVQVVHAGPFATADQARAALAAARGAGFADAFIR